MKPITWSTAADAIRDHLLKHPSRTFFISHAQVPKVFEYREMEKWLKENKIHAAKVDNGLRLHLIKDSTL